MAYRRRYNKRKRTYRKKSSMWNIARKAASKLVRYYLNPEYKFLDSTGSLTTFSNAGTIVPLTYIAQGDTDQSRDGNSIKLTSQLLRLTITKATGPATTRARILIFKDASSAGAIPTVTSVLQSADVLSPMNRVNGTRFKVLREMFVSLDNDDPEKSIHHFKKFQHHVKYLDGTATATSLGQEHIYLLFISDQNGANSPLYSFNNRFRFLDN